MKSRFKFIVKINCDIAKNKLYMVEMSLKFKYNVRANVFSKTDYKPNWLRSYSSL